MAEAPRPPLPPVLRRWQPAPNCSCAAAAAAVHEAAAVAVVAVVEVGAAGAVTAKEAEKVVAAVGVAAEVAVAGAAVAAWLTRPELPPPDSGGRADAPRSTPHTRSALRMPHTAPSEG